MAPAAEPFSKIPARQWKEAKRRLDECLAKAAAAEAEQMPEPEEPQPAEEPVTEEAPAAAPAPLPAAPVGEKGCRDGDERWVEFDGPHPFSVPPADAVVRIRVALIFGTDRTDRLGSLNQARWVGLDASNRAESIDFGTFGELSPDQIRDAFSGPGGLRDIWDQVGSAANQVLTITLSYEARHVMAGCDRKEECIDGNWVPVRGWRSRTSQRIEPVSEARTFSGNVEAGKGLQHGRDVVPVPGAVLEPHDGPRIGLQQALDHR